MPAIYPVAAGRVSDQLIHSRLSSQFNYDKLELTRLMDQVSTGLRLSAPSDDAPAATRAITVQRLLEQKQQSITNITTTSSYVGATDNALSRVSELLTNIRGEALAAVNSTTTESQRRALVEDITRALEQLTSVGNHSFRGRYLFGGSQTAEAPFAFQGNQVVYRGNQVDLQSVVDANSLLTANVNGDQVFGAISAEVRGSVDLNPVVTLDTKLSSLREGQGIAKGRLLISDGNSNRQVDLSSAETLRDVVRLIEANAPEGRQLIVRLTNNALTLDIDDAGGGNLTIREVAGGVTAQQLGILNTPGVGTAPLVGADLQPRLEKTTRVENILGSRAAAVLNSTGLDNDIWIEAAANGPSMNGVSVQVVATGSVVGNAANVTFDDLTGVLQVDVNPSATTANTVVQAINATGQFRAQLDDKLDRFNSGSGLVQVGASTSLAGGSGMAFDQHSGLQIVNGNQTHVIRFDTAETMEDMLNLLNGSPAQVIAKIAADGKSLEIKSRLSGVDFSIGENGGTTAADLGIRTFTRATRLDDLNHGRGVDLTGGNDALAADPNFIGSSTPHVDFTVRRAGLPDLDIDVRSAVTIGDVIDLINHHPDNQGPAPVTARLSEFGNGLAITDNNNTGQQTLTIVRRDSFAAWDLGLIERNQDTAELVISTPATATVTFPQPQHTNTGFVLSATVEGPSFNGVNVVFRDILTGDSATSTFVGGTLFIDMDAGQTTTNTVLAAINASGDFTATLEQTLDPTNDGTGVISTTGTVSTFAGGSFDTIQGRDVGGHETPGIFNSLLRLSRALTDFDLVEIGRTVALLDEDFERLTFMRAEVGSRQRSLDVLTQRVQDEHVQLQSTLSTELDTDMVQAISDLSARQANMEATLRLVGQTFQLSLLNFL